MRDTGCTGLRYGAKIYPEDTAGFFSMNDTNGYWFVDGDKSTGGGGKSWEDAFATIVAAEAAASAGDTIFVAAKTVAATDTDPDSYTENLTINTPQLSIIGVSRGRTQGGLPQVKVGTTTTSPIFTIAAPGVLIANLGFNGSGATGGGILLDDDEGSTKSCFGWTIANCHFKNCVGTTATDCRTGGAVTIGSRGNAWQGLLIGCKFYKCVGDFVLQGTSGSIPQDITIEDCIFSGPAANVDCNIFAMGGGDGINGLTIRNCEFPAMPAIGSGSVARYFDLTGCVGMISGCRFASITSPTGSEVTFAAAGTGGKLPAAMHIVDCFGETTTTAETGEIFRT